MTVRQTRVWMAGLVVAMAAVVGVVTTRAQGATTSAPAQAAAPVRST